MGLDAETAMSLMGGGRKLVMRYTIELERALIEAHSGEFAWENISDGFN